MRNLMLSFTFLATSLYLIGCVPVPYIGVKLLTPSRHIVVVDTNDLPLTNYDLYVYRGTDPGSKCDQFFFFPARTESDFHLPWRTKLAIKRLGGVWLAPDFYVSYEPQPYWVAAINKAGYKSRRWSLNESQGDPVKIILEPSTSPGEDFCDGTAGPCNPCRSYEYSMYNEVMRYRHSDCPP